MAGNLPRESKFPGNSSAPIGTSSNRSPSSQSPHYPQKPSTSTAVVSEKRPSIASSSNHPPSSHRSHEYSEQGSAPSLQHAHRSPDPPVSFLPGAASLMKPSVESVHDILPLFDSYHRKEYISGWVHKKNDLMPDGKRFQHREWVLYFAALNGSILSLWKVPEDQASKGIYHQMDPESIRVLRFQTDPSFINITDASVEWVGVYPKRIPLFHGLQCRYLLAPMVVDKAGYNYHVGVLALNSAGANRFYIQPYIDPTMSNAISLPSTPVLDRNAGGGSTGLATPNTSVYADEQMVHAILNHWIVAIRLSVFEHGLLCQLYTEALLRRNRHFLTLEQELLWPGFGKDPKSHAATNVCVQGWLQIRLAGTIEWKQYWCVVKRRPIFHANTKKKPRWNLTSWNNQLSETLGRGHLLLFHDQKDAEKGLKRSNAPGKEHLALQHAALEVINVSDAYSIFPEKPELVEMSTIFKIEGGSVLIGGKASADTTSSNRKTNKPAAAPTTMHPNFVLCMATSQTEMSRFLNGVWSAFSLNGRAPDEYDPTNVPTGKNLLAPGSHADQILDHFTPGVHRHSIFLDSGYVGDRLYVRQQPYEETKQHLWRMVLDKKHSLRQQPLLPPPIVGTNNATFQVAVTSQSPLKPVRAKEPTNQPHAATFLEAQPQKTSPRTALANTIATLTVESPPKRKREPSTENLETPKASVPDRQLSSPKDNVHERSETSTSTSESMSASEEEDYRKSVISVTPRASESGNERDDLDMRVDSNPVNVPTHRIATAESSEWYDTDEPSDLETVSPEEPKPTPLRRRQVPPARKRQQALRQQPARAAKTKSLLSSPISSNLVLPAQEKVSTFEDMLPDDVSANKRNLRSSKSAVSPPNDNDKHVLSNKSGDDPGLQKNTVKQKRVTRQSLLDSETEEEEDHEEEELEQDDGSELSISTDGEEDISPTPEPFAAPLPRKQVGTNGKPSRRREQERLERERLVLEQEKKALAEERDRLRTERELVEQERMEMASSVGFLGGHAAGSVVSYAAPPSMYGGQSMMQMGPQSSVGMPYEGASAMGYHPAGAPMGYPMHMQQPYPMATGYMQPYMGVPGPQPTFGNPTHLAPYSPNMAPNPLQNIRNSVSPTPSDSVSITQHRMSMAPASSFQPYPQPPAPIPEEPQPARGLISEILKERKSRSTAYDPRLGVHRSRNEVTEPKHAGAKPFLPPTHQQQYPQQHHYTPSMYMEPSGASVVSGYGGGRAMSMYGGYQGGGAGGGAASVVSMSHGSTYGGPAATRGYAQSQVGGSGYFSPQQQQHQHAYGSPVQNPVPIFLGGPTSGTTTTPSGAYIPPAPSMNPELHAPRQPSSNKVRRASVAPKKK